MNKNPNWVLAAWVLAALPLTAAEKTDYHANFPKGDAAWNVTFQKAGAAALKPEEGKEERRDIKSIRVVRRGELRRDTVLWTDGSSTEYWWSRGAQIVVFQAEKNGPVSAMKSGLMEARRLDESMFAWVGNDSFKKEQDFMARKSAYFETRVPLGEGERQERQAWLDLETMRPLAWSNGAVLAVFAFENTPPRDVLVMPAEFKKKLERYEAYAAPPKKLGKP
jgi:hypothetical protein